ncbi:MAG: response regulator [Desulfarculaceae bacterium]|nr:response regulator [Desulfarculaceae bacterium]MCF8074308.1 response regulator [Desulfarculaceae bacterium]MCF8103376.1 response regulator [Desulfarculaceae bacterium]MCF8117769.1 response regulator [Desulfarculaceae bacterium]
MSAFKVLIVDDEVDFLESLVRRLKRRMVDATGVTSGEAALKYLAAQPADVVVLDVKMPGMNGIDTLREIKKSHPQVEVILLTGHASVESGVEGLTLEAFDYLIKPVKLDELIERIMEAFDRRKVVGEISSAERDAG